MDIDMNYNTGNDWGIFLARYNNNRVSEVILRGARNGHIAILWQNWCGKTGPIAYEYLTTHGLIGDDFEPWAQSAGDEYAWIDKILAMESLEIFPEMKLYTMEEFKNASEQDRYRMLYVLDKDDHVYFKGDKTMRCDN